MFLEDLWKNDLSQDAVDGGISICVAELQADFRNFRSCADNLTILTNHVHLAFMNRVPLLAVFLDITGAFDDVIPSILVQDLRTLGFPARTCKFIENLLCERYIRFVENGELSEPRTVHKGTPQGSILSPLLFNIYLREISRHLHPDTNLLQYADDIVLYSWNSVTSLVHESVSSSLSLIYEFLKYRGLDLSPAKSKFVVYSISVEDPPQTLKVFLSITLKFRKWAVPDFLEWFWTVGLMVRKPQFSHQKGQLCGEYYYIPHRHTVGGTPVSLSFALPIYLPRFHWVWCADIQFK